MDTGTYVLAVPQQFMGSFLQETGAQEAQNGDVSNQKPRVSLYIHTAIAQEEGFGQGPEPLVGQIRWGYNMPFRQGGVKKGRNTNSNSEYGLNGCQERWLFLSRS